MSPRRIGKVDANQSEIVEALRSCGARVLLTHTLGKGAPDIFVLWSNRWTPIEIKTIGGKLTNDEIEWWDLMGYNAPIIAHNDQEAMLACGIPIYLPFAERQMVYKSDDTVEGEPRLRIDYDWGSYV